MGIIEIAKLPGNNGWNFDIGRVNVDLFHLLSIFLAEKEYSTILKELDDPLWSLASLGEPEVTRLLVSTAVVGRILSDRPHVKFTQDSNSVGTVTAKKSSKPLTLRNSFNKIIHAESFSLFMEDIGKEGFTYLHPDIGLTGKWQGEPWEAKLNITSYVREYHRNFGNLLMAKNND